ncbi:hypothetical protein DESA109040_16890 [Deinococcus saxicola]
MPPAALTLGTYPAGTQPSAGIRTMSAPKIMNRKYTVPMIRNVELTPSVPSPVKRAISAVPSGLPISAPPPKPMMAIPVASPGRSGNHLISVLTGLMYPRPRPIPPITPLPSSTSHSMCSLTPRAAIRKPPQNSRALANMVLRGPSRSTHLPNSAELAPRKNSATLKISPT